MTDEDHPIDIMEGVVDPPEINDLPTTDGLLGNNSSDSEEIPF